jgi:hypothetical protein
MDRITLLMFHRDDPQGVVRAIRQLRSVCEEIVVIDSSSVEGRQSLARATEGTPTRILRALPLGCTEPLRPYAHAVVDSPWVFSVDTDEEVSPELAQRLPSLPETWAGYAVPRFERAFNSVTWHVRLYRPDKLRYAGWIHEDPKPLGPVGRLAPEERLIHWADYARYLENGGRRSSYPIIESLERPFTAESLRAEFDGRWLGRVAGHGEAALSRSRAALFLAAWYASQWLPGSSPWRRRLHRRYFLRYLRGRYRHFYGLPESDRREATDLAQELRAAGGPTPYLGFEDPRRIDRLTATVPDDVPGGEILRSLLLYRHRTGRCMDTWGPVPAATLG